MTTTKHAYDELPVKMVDVGHARLAYRTVGRGPDLVFVHGWPLTGATFRDIVFNLADQYTCHVFDLPGAGETTYDDFADISVTRHIDAIERAVDEIGLADYSLVGHDSGALITRVVAARHGSRVKAVVMGNTEIPGHKPWMLALYVALGRMPGIRAMMPLTLRSRLYRHTNLGFGGCFDDRSHIDGAFHDRFVAPLLGSKRIAAGQMGLLINFDFSDVDRLPETHAAMESPTQMIWGAKDPWFPIDKARAMLRDLPDGSELEVIDDGKLFVHEEHPERFAAYARKFLARHMPPIRLSASA